MSLLSDEQDTVVEAFRAVDPRLQVESRPLERGTFAVVTFTTGARVVLNEAGVVVPEGAILRGSRSVRRAVDTIAADVLARTVRFGEDRPDVLDGIARVLIARERELREARINAGVDD